MPWTDIISTGPGINVIFTALVRAFFVFAPVIGILTKDQDHFVYRDKVLADVKEFMGTLNTRVLMLSWSPLIAIGLLSRVADLPQSVKPWSLIVSVLVMVVIVVLISIISIKVPVSVLRHAGARYFIFVLVTFLDLLFRLELQEPIVRLISS